MRRARADIDVPNVVLLEMPMEVGLELGAVIRLHDLDAKWQPAAHLVDEPNRRALIAGVIDLEYADPRAVVDGRELIQPRARARDALEEFHVNLQPMPRLWFFIAAPASEVRPMLLIGRQPWHPVPGQDPMHGGRRDRNLMKAREIGPDA